MSNEAEQLSETKIVSIRNSRQNARAANIGGEFRSTNPKLKIDQCRYMTILQYRRNC